MSKAVSTKEKIRFMKERRDQKVRDHLSQYAPVWLEKDDPLLEEDALVFQAVFLHPQYGWVRRRYRYDAYNDVLYHKGQVVVDEEQTLRLQEQEPYLSASALNTVDSYGG